MASTTRITLPEQLLPSDGRFGSGPSKVPVWALDALAETGPTLLGTSHRRPAVKDLVGLVRKRLRQLFQLPDGYEVVLGNGGATLFWDAAVFSLIKEKSQHLVFGEFSSKFAAAAAAAPHLGTISTIEAPYGSCPTPVADPNVDCYALTHNETSTGVLAPLLRPDKQALVLVDATSAAGAVAVDPTVFDAYYFSLQKAFGSEGGLFIALLSPDAVSRLTEVLAQGRFIPASLDLSIALENSRANQTYNTPSITTLFLLNSTLEWMLTHGGLAFAANRSATSAAHLYRWAEASSVATPFVSEPSLRSPVVATIDFVEEVDAATIASILRENGIIDTEPYRKLGRNQLRIALFPHIDPSDVEALTSCIDYIVERL
ncbi:MAG: phosphoserine transaminase [Ferrimicrobium sp.]